MGSAAASLWPVGSGGHRPPIGSACLATLKYCVVGQIMYATDYDDTLPPAGMWMDMVKPYVSTEAVFHCPVFKNDPDRYGYAMKIGLSEKQVTPIVSPETQVLLFESVNLTRNANGAFAMPDPPRHGTAGSVAYLDGHASKLTPAQAASAGKKKAPAHP
jgi:prepilin-type processing-associated H-X9-DG protein